MILQIPIKATINQKNNLKLKKYIKIVEVIQVMKIKKV